MAVRTVGPVCTHVPHHESELRRPLKSCRRRAAAWCPSNESDGTLTSHGADPAQPGPHPSIHPPHTPPPAAHTPWALTTHQPLLRCEDSESCLPRMGDNQISKCKIAFWSECCERNTRQKGLAGKPLWGDVGPGDLICGGQRRSHQGGLVQSLGAGSLPAQQGPWMPGTGGRA